MREKHWTMSIALMLLMSVALTAAGEVVDASNSAQKIVGRGRTTYNYPEELPVVPPKAVIQVPPRPEPARPGLVITRADTEGKVEDGLARLTMEVEAESYRKGEQRVVLFTSDVALTDWNVKSPFWGGDAHVTRTDRGVELVVEGQGKYVLSIGLVARVQKERLGRKVVLPVLNALAASTRLEVPGKDLEFDAQPMVSMETKVGAAATTVTFYGGEGLIVLTWRPKAPEKVVRPVVFADQTSRVRIGRGVLRLDSTIDYSIVQGSVGEFEIRLPAECSLLNIEGEDIRTWDIAESGEGGWRTLKVTLLADVEKAYRLLLSLEKVLPGIEMQFDVPTVEPLAVIREKGRVAVSAPAGIRVEAAALDGISPVDVREMLRLPGVSGEDVRLAFRYLKRPFSLGLRTGEVVAKTSVEILTLVRAGMDSMRLTSDLNYTIRDAGVFQFRVRLDEGLKLIDINGTNINNWQLDETGRVLTVALRSKAEGVYKLQIETESEQSAGEGAPIQAVHALDVDREAGYVAVLPAPGMKVETAAVAGISQVDVKELPDALLKESPALAYRYIRPDFQLAVNVSEIEPEVNAEVRTVATLDEHELSLDTRIHYTIRRAGIFQLRVAIPKDLRRTNIEGEEIDDTSWDEREGILTVNLRGKVTGSYILKIATEKTLKEIEKGLDLPVLSAVGVKKERGFIGLVTKASVRVKPAEGKMVELDDISVSDLPPDMLKRAGRISLAFKYFSQPWSLALAVERIQPRVTAEVFNLLSIGEKLMTVSSTVSYQILHSGVDTFVVKLPADATAVDIDGDAIKHREQDKETNTWTITLQSKRMDAYTLYISFQQKLAQDQTDIPYAGVSAQDIHRETGYLAVTSRPDVEITAADQDIDNLTPIDSREIPADYLQGVTLPVLQAYRYVSHPYMIRITAVPHDAAEVTVAVVESVRLSTTVTEEGNMITDMVGMLRSSRQQYLDLKLPEKARIWHAFVAGQPVTPLRDGRTTKIPVARAGSENAPLEVRLRYSDEREQIGRVGAIRLESPMQDIDIMRLGWTLSLPEGYDVVRDTGNIKRLDSYHLMAEQLRQLDPDTEVEARISRRAAQSGKMNVQMASNAFAIEQIEAGRQGGPGRMRSIYTGSRPEQANRVFFQALIVRRKETAWVEVQFVKGSVGIPLKGVVVLVMLGVSGLVWRLRQYRRVSRVGILLACSLVLLAVRTLVEGAYRGYLNAMLITLVALAVALFFYTVYTGLRDGWRRRASRRAEAVKELKPTPEPTADERSEEGRTQNSE